MPVGGSPAPGGAIDVTRRMLAGMIALATTIASAAGAQVPAFDPREWKPDVAGPKTQILVLGTMHLSGLPGFQPAWMGAVVDRAAAWRPTIVTIESVSGQQCDLLRRYPLIYPGVADQYCRSTDAAKKATGLDVPQAAGLVEATLATWPAQPGAAARRRLASLFLAADEPASALVQWLRLPEGERRAADGLDEALVKLLVDVAKRPNENYQLGAVLAVRAGLDRVYAVDDHTSDSVQSEDPAFGTVIQQIWSAPNPVVEASKAQPFASPTDMLDSYRMLNTPKMQRAAIGADFGRAIRHVSRRYWGRQYVGWWEVRNLRMVANIRAAFAPHPGARVLSIVGASHKPYFDAYLNMMHEVQLADAEAVLR